MQLHSFVDEAHQIRELVFRSAKASRKQPARPYFPSDFNFRESAWLQDVAWIVAACVDGEFRVVDPEEVKVTHSVQPIECWAYALAVHPTDHSIVVAGANGQIQRIVLEQTP